MATRLHTTVAGKYRLVELVGAGAFGEVYRAEHVNLPRQVAVKILRAELARDRQAVRRFEEEGARTARVHHPGVVEVHDVGLADDGCPYQLMELLTGQSLATELNQYRQLPIPRAIALAQQILEALGAVHAAGLIHRDVKPENVFLQRDLSGERVKLVDFGIAKLVDDEGAATPLTAAGKPLGTPYYMAPEQALDPGRVDPRADVYAAGATLFEMLCGRTVLAPAELIVVLGKVVAGDIDRNPKVYRSEVPGWLDAIVQRSLMLLPRDRFGDAQAMLNALRNGVREAAGAGHVRGRLSADDFEEDTRRSSSQAGEITNAGDGPTRLDRAPSAEDTKQVVVEDSTLSWSGDEETRAARPPDRRDSLRDITPMMAEDATRAESPVARRAPDEPTRPERPVTPVRGAPIALPATVEPPRPTRLAGSSSTASTRTVEPLPRFDGRSTESMTPLPPRPITPVSERTGTVPPLSATVAYRRRRATMRWLIIATVAGIGVLIGLLFLR